MNQATAPSDPATLTGLTVVRVRRLRLKDLGEGWDDFVDQTVLELSDGSRLFAGSDKLAKRPGTFLRATSEAIVCCTSPGEAPELSAEVAQEGLLLFDEETGRWHIGDEPLHAGNCFQLRLEDDCWANARFEWQHHKQGRPTGYLVIAVANGGVIHAEPTRGIPARRLETFRS